MDMWKCHSQGKQRPIPDEDTLWFWEGCRRQRLLIQRCDVCKTFRFPPSPMCPHCLSMRHTWQDDPGRGEVETYCVYYAELAGPAWEAALPYVVVIVQLHHSGVRMLSNLVCKEVQEARIGLPVRVIFDRLDANLTLPKFIPQVPPETSSGGR